MSQPGGSGCSESAGTLVLVPEPGRRCCWGLGGVLFSSFLFSGARRCVCVVVWVLREDVALSVVSAANTFLVCASQVCVGVVSFPVAH